MRIIIIIILIAEDRNNILIGIILQYLITHNDQYLFQYFAIEEIIIDFPDDVA